MPEQTKRVRQIFRAASLFLIFLNLDYLGSKTHTNPFVQVLWNDLGTLGGNDMFEFGLELKRLQTGDAFVQVLLDVNASVTAQLFVQEHVHSGQRRLTISVVAVDFDHFGGLFKKPVVRFKSIRMIANQPPLSSEFIQRFLERSSSAMQTTHHRTNGNIEDFGDFFVRKTFYVSE